MSNKEPRRYEDAAEQRTVTGWACKKCGQFWGDDEHMARYCCSTDFPCKCDGRHEKGWSCCRDCRDKLDLERFEKRERRPWDGEQMLVCDREDRYFSTPEDIYEHIASERDDDLDDGQLHEIAMTMRIVLCRPMSIRWFNLSEFLDEALPEDHDLPAGAIEVEKAVNDWIASIQPLSWEPGKYAWDGTIKEK